MDSFDLLLAKKLADSGGSSTTVEELSVTQNGTYNAETGTAYNPVKVNVPTGVFPQGQLDITSNDRYDVTSYKYANVQIYPSGTLNISQNGTHNVSNYEYANVNVKTDVVVPKDVNFYDYDGTLLYSYTAQEFLDAGTLPAKKTHPGLIANGWNWSVAEIETQLGKGGIVNVGENYMPSESRKTKLYVHLEESCKSPILGIYPSGTVVVDWGDGSSTDTLTGVSLSTKQTVQHTYASSGDYVISLNAQSGVFAIEGDSSGTNLLTATGTASSNNYIYAQTIKKIELAAGAMLGNYAFHNCCGLETISLTDSLRMKNDSTSNLFENCWALKFVALPKLYMSNNSLSTKLESTFRNCYGLKRFSLAPGITALKINFANNSGIEDITIPYTVTSFGSYAFENCKNLKNVVIPDNVTDMGNQTFQSDETLENAVINSTAIIVGSMFNGCRSLKTVSINSNSNGFSTSGNSFNECSCLKSVTIPNIATIQVSVFRRCTSLTNVTIPSTVTTINTNAFNGCYGVMEYHLLSATPPDIAANTFYENQPQCVFYVPYSADHSILTAYQTASNWSSFASQIQEEAQ